MIYLIYLLLAISVVFLAIRLADYIDLLDKKTGLSGAFLGAILLGAVTSLPELFTTLSSTLLIGEGELVIGNILGSNLFNTAIIGLLVFVATKKFHELPISKGNKNLTVYSLIIYAIIAFTLLVVDPQFLGASVASLVIVVIYAIALKDMGEDDGSKQDDTSCSLTVTQITVRFVALSILLILSSIGIVFATDQIAVNLGLGYGVAGAILLGIATSLPEVTAAISLIKRNNFDAAIGSILGSNLFNFLVLFIGDALYTKSSLYLPNSELILLTLLGFIGTLSLYCILLVKSRHSSTARLSLHKRMSTIAILSYVVFLIATLG